MTSRANRIGWRRIAAFCSVAFFSALQPSEAFLTRILLAKGLTDEQLENQVWPADAYAALALMLVVTMASDWLGQRAVIALGLVAWQLVCALLALADSVGAQVVMQIAYAFTTSARVVYFAYLFSVFSRDLEIATACAIAAHHLGSVMGSGLSQILVQFVPLFANNVANLVFVSWASVTLALISFAVAMPAPVRPPQLSFTRLIWTNGWRRSLDDMRATLSSVGWQWIAWWSLAVAGNEIFGNYFQMVVSRLGKGTNFGFGTMAVLIEIAAIIGAVGPIVIAKAKCSDSLPVHATLVSLTSVGMGLLLVFVGLTESAVAASAGIVAVHFVFSAQEGTANVAIAGMHQDSRPSLVFGTATFLALTLATIAQAIASTLKLKSTQYMYVCASLYIGIPLLQALAALIHRVLRARQKADRREPLIDALLI